MEKENDKSTDENFDEIQESDDTDWRTEATKLREKAIRQREKTKELRDSLKSYEAKIVEFEKQKAPEKVEKKSDEQLLKRLDTMALKMAGITADDEKELFEKWKGDTGRDADSIVENKIFQAELADLRTAKANTAATANVGGDGKVSGEKSDPAYWIARTTKGSDGELMFPEDLPNDFRLRAAIVEKMVASTKGDKQFYNQ